MNAREPKPSIDVTYRRADGEPIDDFSWVSGTEWLDEYTQPVEVVEERWTRIEARRFWHIPETLYFCTKVDDCDEDSVAWERQPDGDWVEVCEEHQAQSASTVDACDLTPNGRADVCQSDSELC